MTVFLCHPVQYTVALSWYLWHWTKCTLCFETPSFSSDPDRLLVLCHKWRKFAKLSRNNNIETSSSWQCVFRMVLLYCIVSAHRQRYLLVWSCLKTSRKCNSALFAIFCCSAALSIASTIVINELCPTEIHCWAKSYSFSYRGPTLNDLRCSFGD